MSCEPDSVCRADTVSCVLAEELDQLAEGPQQVRGPSRALVIDRDAGFVQVFGRRLDDIGWGHTAVGTPVTPEALVRLRLNVLVVDLTVIGPDCWEYLERVCARLPSLAVVVVTGPSSVAQRIRGLRAGVDAWVTKPCHPEELVCVIEAVLRRHRRRELAGLDAPSTIGELTIHRHLHQVYVGEKSLELTAREFEILDLLCRCDRVLRREEIYERVWGYAMAHGDRSVDVFVGKLRQKLRRASASWSYIHTHFGVGYRFAPTQDRGAVRSPATPQRDAPAKLSSAGIS
jgi:DNA-binding response OmpR family regulator